MQFSILLIPLSAAAPLYYPFHTVSLYLLDRNQYKEPAPLPSFPSKNPYKGTRKLEDEEKIPAEVKKQYVDKILNLVLYDAEDCQALRNFEPIISSTHCIFAKKSVIWGASDYDRKLTVGEELAVWCIMYMCCPCP